MAAIGAIPHDALSGFTVLGERAGRRRAAGRHRGQCSRRRPDLSRKSRSGSGLGQPVRAPPKPPYRAGRRWRRRACRAQPAPVRRPAAPQCPQRQLWRHAGPSWPNPKPFRATPTRRKASGAQIARVLRDLHWPCATITGNLAASRTIQEHSFGAGKLGAAPLPLDLVPDQRSDIGAAEVFHRADAGRRGDIDLGEEAADHVDTDEQQAPLAQSRP